MALLIEMCLCKNLAIHIKGAGGPHPRRRNGLVFACSADLDLRFRRLFGRPELRCKPSFGPKRLGMDQGDRVADHLRRNDRQLGLDVDATHRP